MHRVRSRGKEINWRRVAQALAPVFVLLLICAALSLLTPRFLTEKNLINVVRQSSLNGIVAAGMTLVILTGGIDLSVGSLLAVTSVFAAGALQDGNAPLTAMAVGVLIGLGFGLLNGLIVTIGDVAPFIVTLGTMTIARGVALIYTNGAPILATDADFRYIGRGNIGFLPPAWTDRVSKCVGLDSDMGPAINDDGSKDSRRFAARGQRPPGPGHGRPRVLQWNDADPSTPSRLRTTARGGGTSLAGGRGGIIGTLVGALIIGVLSNGLNLMNVNAYYQPVAKGLVILIAILVDRRMRTTSAA